MASSVKELCPDKWGIPSGVDTRRNVLEPEIVSTPVTFVEKKKKKNKQLKLGKYCQMNRLGSQVKWEFTPKNVHF